MSVTVSVVLVFSIIALIYVAYCIRVDFIIVLIYSAAKLPVCSQ